MIFFLVGGNPAITNLTIQAAHFNMMSTGDLSGCYLKALYLRLGRYRMHLVIQDDLMMDGGVWQMCLYYSCERNRCPLFHSLKVSAHGPCKPSIWGCGRKRGPGSAPLPVLFIQLLASLQSIPLPSLRYTSSALRLEGRRHGTVDR